MLTNDQLANYSRSHHVDIALLQEPYTRRGRLIGLDNPPMRITLSAGALRAGNNSKIFGAAIVVFNPRLRFVARTNLATENITVITLSTGHGHVNLVSAYFKYRIPTDVHIRSLGNVLDALTGDTIICADVNAASPRWFATHTDPRGRLVSDFLDRRSLHLANVFSPNFTFRGPRGSSNVDVTLSQKPDVITDLRVVINVTDSDHELIHFTYHTGAIAPASMKPDRFNVNRANWDQFSSGLISVMATINEQFQQADVHMKSEILTNAITHAAVASIPKGGQPKIQKPTWWSPTLQDLRKKMRNSARRRYLLDGGGLTAEYRYAKSAYKKQLRLEKTNSWKSFCSGGSINILGSLYRWMKRGTIISEVLSVLKKPDGSFTNDIEETAKLHVNTLIPGNCDYYNDPEESIVIYNIVPCDLAELKESVWKTSPARAPGIDCITAKMVRMAWCHISTVYLQLVNECLYTGTFQSPWKCADVVPILKNKDADRDDPKSFRPISLLPVMAKALERVICTRLIGEIELSLSGQHLTIRVYQKDSQHLMP